MLTLEEEDKTKVIPIKQKYNKYAKQYVHQIHKALKRYTIQNNINKIIYIYIYI